MKTFTVSAPGKIILAGEHAVVYGYRGIASSIDLRCYATIIDLKKDDKIMSLHLRNLSFDFEFSELEFKSLFKKVLKENCGINPLSSKYQRILNEFIDEKFLTKMVQDDDFIRQGLMVFIDLCLFMLKNSWRALDISINSEFSYGCGLGSSAAYSTVLATALLIIRDDLDELILPMDQLKLISSLAFRGEQIVHGTPSGIDNCISSFGGALLFKRTEKEIVRRVINAPHVRVLLVDTRVKRCTKKVVKHVKNVMSQSVEQYHRIFSSIDDIAMKLSYQLSESHPNRIECLNQLVEENQIFLKHIGVSHPSIDDVVQILKAYGISAKLTGAGWGGCVFAFVEGVNENVINNAIKSLKEGGYGVQLSYLSCPGVQIILNTSS